jgi:putative transposase
MAAWARGQ